MAMEREMSSDLIVEKIYQAAKSAFSELFASNEHFYYCVLITTEEGHAPFVSAWSKESLERASKENAEDKGYAQGVKWSYADSPYIDFSPESFDEIKEIFFSRPGIEDLSAEEWLKELDFRILAMENAIKMIDAEGLFSKNQPRNSVLINVEIVPPDYSNTTRAIRLNSNDNTSLAEWLREAAEQE